MATFTRKIYLVIQPQRNRYWPERVTGFQIVRMLRKRPDPGVSYVEVDLELPEAMFNPPKVKITLADEEVAKVQAQQSLKNWISDT